MKKVAEKIRVEHISVSTIFHVWCRSRMGIRQLLTLAGAGCFDRSFEKNRYLVKIGPHSEI